MRTLDEVIESMQLTSDVNRNYREENADVLHYLVEYRACQQHMQVVEQIRQDAVRQRDAHIKALAELKRNDPLSWEELKQMEGKPVWVEYDGYTPDWEVIENVGAMRGSIGDITGNFIETHMSVLHKDDMGKTWQAYRKERTE